MPWHGPRWSGEFPSLGYLVTAWQEAHCVIPDRIVAGDPLILSDEQAMHQLWQYRLWPEARFDPNRPAAPFVYYGSLLVRSQKWGKAPFSAARLAAQAEGPVLFAGWAQGGESWDCADHGCRCGWEYVYEPGEPMGLPWATPHLQVAATSDDQTDNIWRALKPMIERGPLASVIVDTGLDRMNLRGGGIIEKVSNNATTRLGARIVYVEIDQPESMTATNGGEKLVDTLLRNVAGMGGRWAATGNAHDPSQESVQQTWIDKPTGTVHIDYPEPLEGSWTNKRDRRRILKHAYQGSPWVDVDRIEADCDRLAAKGDPGQAERWFGNRVVAGAAKAFDRRRFELLGLGRGGIAAGRLVTLGFDGAKRFDSTGLIATDVELGHQVVVAVWERPLELPESAPWGVPIGEVNDAVDFCFTFWRVWRMNGDPPHYVDDLARWAGLYGDDKVVEWWTNRVKPMAYALREYHEAMGSEDTPAVLSHGPLDGSPEARDAHAAFIRHVGNAVRRTTKMRDEHGWLWTISKDAQKSVRKIDLAMAGCLSWTARQDAIRAGALKQPEYARAAWQ